MTTIMAIDIGAGTQDVLIYDSNKTIENCMQLVLPSPTQMVAQRITQATSNQRHIYLNGYLMGGGASSKAVKRHLKKGLQVTAHPEAAKTINDNLDVVKNLGITLSRQSPPDAYAITLGDIIAGKLSQLLDLYNVQTPEIWCVAAQDHGEALYASDRKKRFQFWQQFLNSGGDLKELIFKNPPKYLTRLLSIQKQQPGALVMDTGAAAVWGALCDEKCNKWSKEGVTIINIGNGHTLGILVKDREVLGLFEDHTASLTTRQVQDFAHNLQKGTLRNEDIFQRGGHGAAYSRAFDPQEFGENIVVTGPNRHLVKDTNWYWAAPYGNMMLSGAFGLVKAFYA